MIILEWLKIHYIEIFGALTGLLYIYFSIKENILLWPTGIISSAVYIYVFFHSKFYADMSLQVYYLVISIYGWYLWAKGNSKDAEDNLPITKTPKKLYLILFFITLVLFVGIGIILDKFTDSPLPFWDSFTTSLSITATWMLAKKYIEQWHIWIIVDTVSAALYIYKGLYPTVVLFIVFTIMAVVGYLQWKKSLVNA